MLNLKDISELEVLKQDSDYLALVVTGDSCVPCSQLKQHIEETVENSLSEITFATISGTQNREWAASQGIRSVPTTILYDVKNDSKTVLRGFTPATKETYEQDLRSAIHKGCPL